MEAVNLDDWPRELSALIERAAARGEVELKLAGQPLAKLVPIKPAEEPFDWDELRAFTNSLPFDPIESVVEMRKQARY